MEETPFDFFVRRATEAIKDGGHPETFVRLAVAGFYHAVSTEEYSPEIRDRLIAQLSREAPAAYTALRMPREGGEGQDVVAKGALAGDAAKWVQIKVKD